MIKWYSFLFIHPYWTLCNNFHFIIILRLKTIPLMIYFLNFSLCVHMCICGTCVGGMKCVCLYMWMCRCTCLYICAFGGQGSASYVFFYFSPPIVWDKVCHWTQSSPFKLDWLASKLPGVWLSPLTPLGLGLQVMLCLTFILMLRIWARALMLPWQALHTEPSLHPPRFLISYQAKIYVMYNNLYEN